MGWMRIGILIALTVVAATMPATAERSTTTTPAKTTSDQPAQPNQSDKQDEATGLILHAAPNADVWTSPTTRPPIGDTQFHAIATLAAAPLQIRPWLISGQVCRYDINPAPEQTRAWLICRYPNAPPAGL